MPTPVDWRVNCEAAALKMALSYYGISADELQLISYMTRDTRPARFDASGRLARWGDPVPPMFRLRDPAGNSLTIVEPTE